MARAGRIDLIDLIGWAAILLWIVLSAYFLWDRNPSVFQAVGVVGIAAGVGYFAMQHHAVPHPYGALEIQSIINDRIALASEASLHALAQTSLLAKALVADASKRGEQPSPVFTAVASVGDEHLAATLSYKSDDAIDRQKQILERELAANFSVLDTRRNSEVLQAVIVVVATLQFGLGAYFLEIIGLGVS